MNASSTTKKTRIKDSVQIINELRRKYPLKDLLKLVEMARSTFYYHLKNMELPDKHKEPKKEFAKYIMIIKGVTDIYE